LYGALVAKSDFHSFYLFFLFQLFCSARAEPFFRPGRSLRGPSRAAAIKDGAPSLTAASTTAGCVGLGRHIAPLVRDRAPLMVAASQSRLGLTIAVNDFELVRIDCPSLGRAFNGQNHSALPTAAPDAHHPTPRDGRPAATILVKQWEPH